MMGGGMGLQQLSYRYYTRRKDIYLAILEVKQQQNSEKQSFHKGWENSLEIEISAKTGKADCR